MTPHLALQRARAMVATAGTLAAVTFAAFIVMPPSVSVAAPAPAAPAPGAPISSDDALHQLRDLSRSADVLSEQVNHAREALDKKVAATAQMEAQLADARAALEQARADKAQYQPVVDDVARARYIGAAGETTSAVLMSDSPQVMLDQISSMYAISSHTKLRMKRYAAASATAKAAEDRVNRTLIGARAAAADALKVSADLERRQSELQMSMGAVLASYAALTAADRSKYAGPVLPADLSLEKLLATQPKGSRGGALTAALTKIGAPYSWGATGPSEFDCSGLMVWAYRQVGVTLPRSSYGMANFGTPVAREDLQPGDLIITYGDQHHVVMYAGNGLVIHASTFGVPVAVVPMEQGGPFQSARRV